MTDKLLIENYLLILKSTIEVFVHGTLESSNKDIKSMLWDGLDDTLTHQEDTYNIMCDYGWYKVNNIKSSQIEQTLNNLKK